MVNSIDAQTHSDEAGLNLLKATSLGFWNGPYQKGGDALHLGPGLYMAVDPAITETTVDLILHAGICSNCILH